MATLDRIIEMQNQGLGEQDIISRLQSEGVSPREITTAINQARIKSAVSQDTTNQQVPEAPQTQMQSLPQGNQIQQAPEPMAQQTQPLPQQPQDYQDPYYQQDQYYSEYPQEQYQQSGINISTVNEIIEQKINETSNKLEKQITQEKSETSLIKKDVENLTKRLESIENSIEHLQKTIIGKIGEFGETGNLMRKELDNLHTTMSKMVNPLIDSHRKKHSTETEHKTAHKKKSHR
jgi:archaellum component FlaC